MTTITTRTQRPQKSLIVLIGLAITAVAVAATVTVSQPTATTKPAEPDVNQAALIAEIIATPRPAPLAASDEQLVRGTAGVALLPDSLADAKDRATAGTATPTAPLPDSIADAIDRENVAAATAQNEAAIEAIGGYVAEVMLNGSVLGDGNLARANALEEAVANGGQPGVVVPHDVTSGITSNAGALEEAVQNGGQPGVLVVTVKPPLIDGWNQQWLNNQSTPSVSDQLLEGWDR